MKKLLLSTAILAASGLAASAQDMFRGEASPDQIRASDLMGMRVYASADANAADTTEIDGVQDNWDDIGEVGDILLKRDGSVDAVLVDIGGFLGMGERQVAVGMNALKFVSDSATADNLNDYFLVISADRAALEGAPDYMAGQMAEGAQQTATDVEAASTGTAAATGTAAEGVENAVEETGEETADAAGEVADEVSDAGEEVAEEAGQVGMTDTQENADEAADTQADAGEEATEESAQATDEMADEQADAAETAAETGTGDATATETMAADTATTDAATTDMAATDPAAADDTMAADTTTTDTATTDGTMATDEAMTADDGAVAREPFSREGYVALGADMMTADALQGAAVYDSNDERVGEVGELLIDEAGKVSDVVIDVGGFLGIGEKPVSLPMTSLDVLQQDGGDDLRVYVSQTKDELNGMETYQKNN